MFLSVIYFSALAVIVVAAAVVALRHREIPLGALGSLLLCGVALFALLGIEYTPRQWITGLLGCLAALLLVAGHRWRLHVREQKRLAALRCRRSTDRRPPAETAGGEHET